MASPLHKRFPRELKNNLGKYLGIFLLMAVAISLTTGFLAAAASIEAITDGVRDKYVQEDGQFVSNFKVSDGVLFQVEDLGVKVYPNFSRDVDLTVDAAGEGSATGEDAAGEGSATGEDAAGEGDLSGAASSAGSADSAGADAAADSAGSDESTVAQVMRVFAVRTQVDLAAYFEGSEPATANEIAIDRVYAVHHGIEVGDTIALGGTPFTVSGIVSLSDYQALFEKNSDFVFNAQSFCVGEVTQEAFDSLEGGTLRYAYSFVCDDRDLPDADRISLEEDMADVLSDANVSLSDFVDVDANKAIGYAADDVQGDQLMWEVMLWLIVAIMAFVFVILTGSTIEEESAVIGTLLASGYRKGELVRHYLALPMIVGIAGAAVGNVLGYTLMADPMKDLYYNSYSLPPYEAMWNPRVFVFTTVIPLVLLLVITVLGLVRKLGCTPLQFLRHEISRTSRRRSARLPEKLGFASRFRLRVFLRNLPNFATLFFGIMFSSLLLIFGLCLIPCIQSYASDLRASLVAEHTYTLKAPLELEGTDEQRAAYAAAFELSRKVDMSAIDEDAMGDALADIISERAKTRVEDTLADSFDENALASQIVAQGGTGYIAGISVSDLMSADAGDPFANIDTDDIDIARLVDLGILTTSTVDLTDCGLGVVDLATFDENDVSEDDLDLGAVDFTGIEPADVGLEGVDLGGLTLSEFFQLADAASDVPDDDDAHPVNTLENSARAITQAEKFAATSLGIARLSGEGTEDITVYGIAEDSAYWDEVDVSGGKVVIGSGLADKYDIAAGETFDLIDRYGDDDCTLAVSGLWGSAGNMNVYMSLGTFNETFGNDANYFNGYVSNEALNLDDMYLSSDLTPADMDKIVAQMEDSMGDMGSMMVIVAVLIFIILMYLLTKVVIDHSARSISYMKVFGYRAGEINRLYLNSITTTVVVSLVACLPILFWILGMVVKVAFADYSGNFVIAIEPGYILQDIALGVVSYAVVALLHMRRIKRVPLALALKAQE